MKELNLIYPEKSDIRYKISEFPDGQQNMTLTSSVSTGYIGGGSFNMWQPVKNNFTNEVRILSRLNNFQDLELIICAVKSLNELGVKEIHLYVPYLLGSRSDRKFEEGSCNYLKDVICPILNSMNLQSITVLDPHSDVLEACLNKFTKLSNKELVGFSMSSIYGIGKVGPFTDSNFILLSPDAGANKKIYKVSEELGCDSEIVTCSKHRDSKGKIDKTEVPYFDLSKDAIIIDDICDGGRTFVEIAKVIKGRYENFEREKSASSVGKLYLIVTHGIFSKGFKELNQYFDGIYCTNSYRDIGETEWDGDKKDVPTNVKQINIF